MLQKVEIDDAGETDLIQGEQIDKIEFDEINAKLVAEGKKPATGASGAARHHQGVAADPLVHLGGVVPGDHARAHRGGGQRQGRHARRPQGERHRRPPDPGGHRRDDEPAARGRDQARPAHPRGAREGRGQGCGQGRGGGSCRRCPRPSKLAAIAARTEKRPPSRGGLLFWRLARIRRNGLVPSTVAPRMRSRPCRHVYPRSSQDSNGDGVGASAAAIDRAHAQSRRAGSRRL